MLWAARVLAHAFGTVWELLSRLRRRGPAADPAEELRVRLAEAREREPEAAAGAFEPTPEAAESAPEAVEPDRQSEPSASDRESLRSDVHARARALGAEIRGTSKED